MSGTLSYSVLTIHTGLSLPILIYLYYWNKLGGNESMYGIDDNGGLGGVCGYSTPALEKMIHRTCLIYMWKIREFIKAWRISQQDYHMYISRTPKAILCITLGDTGTERGFEMPRLYLLCIRLHQLACAPPPPTSGMAFLERDQSKNYHSSGKSELRIYCLSNLDFLLM